MSGLKTSHSILYTGSSEPHCQLCWPALHWRSSWGDISSGSNRRNRNIQWGRIIMAEYSWVGQTCFDSLNEKKNNQIFDIMWKFVLTMNILGCALNTDYMNLFYHLALRTLISLSSERNSSISFSLSDWLATQLSYAQFPPSVLGVVIDFWSLIYGFDAWMNWFVRWS